MSDDGIGFEVGRALDRSVMRLHLGLDSAAERVRLAGGTFDIESDRDRDDRPVHPPGAGYGLTEEARRSATGSEKWTSSSTSSWEATSVTPRSRK